MEKLEFPFQYRITIVAPEAADRYWQAKHVAALPVVEAKTRVREEFGEAMKEDYWSAFGAPATSLGISDRRWMAGWLAGWMDPFPQNNWR